MGRGKCAEDASLFCSYMQCFAAMKAHRFLKARKGKKVDNHHIPTSMASDILKTLTILFELESTKKIQNPMQ